MCGRFFISVVLAVAIVCCLYAPPEELSTPATDSNHSHSHSSKWQTLGEVMEYETDDATFELFFAHYPDVSEQTIYWRDGRINLCNDTHLLRFKKVEFAGAFFMPPECRANNHVKCVITYVGESSSAELGDNEWILYNDSDNADLKRAAKFRDLSPGTVYCLAGNAHRYLPQQANVVLLEDFDWSECNPLLSGPPPASYSHFNCSESSQMKDVAIIETTDRKFVMWSKYSAELTESFFADMEKHRVEMNALLEASLSMLQSLPTEVSAVLLNEYYSHELSLLSDLTALGFLDRGSQFGIALYTDHARRIRAMYLAAKVEIPERLLQLERELLAYGLFFKTQ